uniref:AAA+ ATPase domain-containing protein n=1 Tax=Araucaria cunninghamii TaxID=56994 RepID=A0A0D6QUE2_ARACU
MESTLFAPQSITLLDAKTLRWGLRRYSRIPLHEVRPRKIRCSSGSSEQASQDGEKKWSQFRQKNVLRVSQLAATLTIVSTGLPQPPAALAEVAEKKEAARKKKSKNIMTIDERMKWTEGLPMVEEKIPYTNILELKAQGRLKYIIKHPKSVLKKWPEVVLAVLDDDRVVRTALPLPSRDEKFWESWDKLGLDNLIMRAYTPPPPKPPLPAGSIMFDLAYFIWNVGLLFQGSGDFWRRQPKKKEQKKATEQALVEEDIEVEDPLLRQIKREKLELKLRAEAVRRARKEEEREKKKQQQLEKKRLREEEKRRRQQEEEEEFRKLVQRSKEDEVELGRFYYEMAYNQGSRFFLGIFFFVLFYFTAVRNYKKKRKDFEDRKRILQAEDEEKRKMRELEDEELEAELAMDDLTMLSEEERELLEASEKNPQLQAGLQFLKSGANVRRAAGRGRGRRRRPPQYMDPNVDVKFEDVAGMGMIRRELEEIVDFFRYRERYIRRGSRIPSGILLSGEPGTGKTLLAKAVAGEAGVNFFSISASQFVEIFVGVGASRVRTLYQEARENAPAVVFIDELDAVGRTRGLVSGSGGQERDATVNQLLTCLDGFEGKGEVITIAATNRPDVLDPALVRPGRFDRKIQIPRPELEGRIEIIKVHCRKKPVADDVDYEAVGRATVGMVGAQLANIVERASLSVKRDGRTEITTDDLLDAVEGEEGGLFVEYDHSMDLWRKIALNEAALAVASVNFPDMKNIHYVSIAPKAGELKGRARITLDSTKFWIPSVSRQMILDHITVQLAPRAADEIWHGLDQMCTIWADTVDTARKAARELVFAGLSDKKELHGIDGYVHDIDRISEIDMEALRILNMCYERAKKVLQQNRELMDVLVDELIAKKTLEKDEFFQLVDKYGHLDPIPPQPMDVRNARLAEFQEKMIAEKHILTPK